MQIPKEPFLNEVPQQLCHMSHYNSQSHIIYTIHHMAATGGTIISMAIAACTNSILLSEVNPYSWIKHPKRPVGYKPTALVEHLVQASGELDARLKRQFFSSQLDICLRHAIDKNRSLLLREHSHSAFDLNKQRSALLMILDEDNHKVVSIVSIRHPLDSFISAAKKGWHKRLAPNMQTLNEYCQNMTKFLNYMLARPSCKLVRYEDFSTDPVGVVSDIGRFYNVRVDESGIDNIFDIPASGFSGRKTEKIEVRKRQELSPNLIEEVKSAKLYHEFCERFGYEVDPEADPIRSKLS